MLNVISLTEAVELIQAKLGNQELKTETVALDSSTGRILAEDIVAKENVPSFDRSTMDGFAVRASDTFGASTALPAMLQIKGEVLMGEETLLEIHPGECAVSPTGGMLPAGADAVVPVEHTDVRGDLCLCYDSVAPLQNVNRKGDDVSEGQIVLKRGTKITPAAVGVLASLGFSSVSVLKKPKIAVISTGNEIVPVNVKIAFGKIRDVNSHLLLSLCSSYGCDCKSYGIIPDEKEEVKKALLSAAEENDVVLLSGGSSAGKADLTAEVISQLGKVHCHGIAVKPGKPTVLGEIGGKAVFGLPGHPAACWFMAELLVRKHIQSLCGQTAETVTTKAFLSENVSSNHGREELLCVRLEGQKAFPLYAKSGVISQLSSADGFIIIPRDSEGLQKGSEITINLFNRP